MHRKIFKNLYRKYSIYISHIYKYRQHKYNNDITVIFSKSTKFLAGPYQKKIIKVQTVNVTNSKNFRENI